MAIDHNTRMDDNTSSSSSEFVSSLQNQKELLETHSMKELETLFQKLLDIFNSTTLLDLQLDILQILCAFANEPQARDTVLSVMQEANECFEKAFTVSVNPKENEKDRQQLQVLMLICLIRVTRYKLEAADALEFLDQNIYQVVDLILQTFQQTFLKLENPAIACLSKLLHSLTLPGTYFTTKQYGTLTSEESKEEETKFHAVEEFSSKMNLMATYLIDSDFFQRLIATKPFQKVVSILKDTAIGTLTLQENTDDEEARAAQFLYCVLNAVLGMILNLGTFTTLQVNQKGDSVSFFRYIVLDSGFNERVMLPYLRWLTGNNFDEDKSSSDLKNDTKQNEDEELYESAWIEFEDKSSSCTYFYNPSTKETVWEIPEGRGLVLKPSRHMRNRIEGVLSCLRILVVAAYRLESSKELFLWQKSWTAEQKFALNPTLVLLDDHSHYWFFKKHYLALVYLLMVNINYNALDVADSTDTETSVTQKELSSNICNILGLLTEEDRARVRSILYYYHSYPIRRDSPTYTLIIGALTSPQETTAETCENVLIPFGNQEEWEELYDDYHQATYYYNPTSQECFWVKPPPLPEGWILMYCDQYQHYYFFNTRTHESTWDRPGIGEPSTSDSKASEDNQSCDAKQGTQAPSTFSEDKADAKETREVAAASTKSVDDKAAPAEETSVEVMQKWMSAARENLAAEKKDNPSDSRVVSSRFRLLGDLPDICPPKSPPPKRRKELGPDPPPRSKSTSKKKSKKSPKKEKAKEKKKSGEVPLKDVPAEFLCGVNKHCMENPVRSPYGHVFDSANITRWIESAGNICPISHKPLTLADLIPDPELRAAITQFHIQQNLQASDLHQRNIASGVLSDDDEDMYSF